MFRSSILQHWHRARTTANKAKIRSNNREITALTRNTSKLFRRATRTNKSHNWNRYKEIHKQFCLKIKERKHKRSENAFERLTESKGTEMMKQISSMLNETKNERRKSCLEKHLINQNAKSPYPKKRDRGIQFSNEFINVVEIACTKAAAGKSTGADELFVERFKIFPRLFAEVFRMIWTKCGTIKYMIKAWNTGVLVPMYMKGKSHESSSYRPITLLSHGQRTTRSAISSIIEKQIKFPDAQLGFKRKSSTETAIVRTTKQLDVIYLLMNAIQFLY